MIKVDILNRYNTSSYFSLSAVLPSYGALKRLIDVVVSLLALILLTPILVIFAAAIFFESPGSIFYHQTRVGERGKPFKLWKFRSMVKNSADIRAQLTEEKALCGGVRFKMQNDPRVTRVGKLIRKFSIDELPQLLNVLQGNMSLVGPRPALPEECEKYNAHQKLRLNAKPGITCIWQVSGRSAIPFHRQVEMDIDYIRRASLWLDFNILLKTVPAVILAKGAC